MLYKRRLRQTDTNQNLRIAMLLIPPVKALKLCRVIKVQPTLKLLSPLYLPSLHMETKDGRRAFGLAMGMWHTLKSVEHYALDESGSDFLPFSEQRLIHDLWCFSSPIFEKVEHPYCQEEQCYWKKYLNFQYKPNDNASEWCRSLSIKHYDCFLINNTGKKVLTFCTCHI